MWSYFFLILRLLTKYAMQVHGNPYCIVGKIHEDVVLLTPKPQSSELPPLLNLSLKLKGGVLSSILMFEGDIFYDLKKKTLISKESEIAHCLSSALMPRTPFKNMDAIAMNRVLCGINKKIKQPKNELLASTKKPIATTKSTQEKKKTKLSDETLSENEDDDDHETCSDDEEDDFEDENEEDEDVENIKEEDEEEEALASIEGFEEEEDEDLEDDNVEEL